MTATYITITKLIAASHRTAIADTIAAYNTAAEAAGCPQIVGGFSRRASLAQYMESVLAELISADHTEALEMNAKRSATLANEVMFSDDHRSLFNKCDPYVRGLMIADAHSEALRANELLDTSALVVLNNRDAWKSASPTVKKLAVALAHADAQEEDYRFNWLHNRWCLFHSSSRQQQEEIIGVAWEQARQTIEADEVYKAQRQRKLEAIWKHTHRDYKGESDGVRSILVCRNGTISVPLEGLTDKEIEQRSSMWQRNK